MIMFCCLLVTIACMPMLAPLMSRFGPGASVVVRTGNPACCPASLDQVSEVPGKETAQLRPFRWYAATLAAALVIVVAGTSLLLTAEEDLSDAALWALALHDAWCATVR